MKPEKPAGVSWFDIVTKTIPIIVAVCSFLWGVYQFNEGRRRDAIDDFNQTVWTMRVKNYEKIADAVGDVMKAKFEQPANFVKAKAAFEKLYWGGMILVEDNEVSDAMVAMRTTLEDYNPKAEGHDEMLEKAAGRVVETCRKHLMAEKEVIETSSRYRRSLK